MVPFLLAAGCGVPEAAVGSEAESLLGAPEPTSAALARSRAATARYHLVENALADGFVPVGKCASESGGGVGFHFAVPSRIDATLDAAEPEARVYFPEGHGLKLVALSYGAVICVDGQP